MPNAGAGGTTNVYFMVLGDNGESRPGHGVTMIMPSARRNNPYIIRNLPAAAGAEPTVLTSAVTKIMVWPVGYALGSASAVSMLQNITPL